jgi:hypothetical protein
MLFLQERLKKDMRVFEYGSGFSTLWLASRVRSVVSIETEEVWYRNLKSKLPSNVQLSLVDFEIDGKYCRLISDYAHEVTAGTGPAAQETLSIGWGGMAY